MLLFAELKKNRVNISSFVRKSIKEKSIIVNQDTGESVEVNPAVVSYGKESISFIFKK